MENQHVLFSKAFPFHVSFSPSHSTVSEELHTSSSTNTIKKANKRDPRHKFPYTSTKFDA